MPNPIFHSLPGSEVALPGTDASATSLLRENGYIWVPQLRGYTHDAPEHIATRARDTVIAALAQAGKPVTHHIFRPRLGDHTHEPAGAATAFTRHMTIVATHLSALTERDEPARAWACTIEHNPTRRTRSTTAAGVWGPPDAHARLQDRGLSRLALLRCGDGERHLLLTAPGTDGAVPDRAVAMDPQTLHLDAPFAEQVPPPADTALPNDPILAAEQINTHLRAQLRAAQEAFARLAEEHVRTAAPDVAVGIHPTFGVVAMTATEDPSPPLMDEILTGCGFDLIGEGIYSWPEPAASDDYHAARTVVASLRTAGIPVRDDLPPPRGTRTPGTAPWAVAASPHNTVPAPAPRR